MDLTLYVGYVSRLILGHIISIIEYNEAILLVAAIINVSDSGYHPIHSIILWEQGVNYMCFMHFTIPECQKKHVNGCQVWWDLICDNTYAVDRYQSATGFGGWSLGKAQIRFHFLRTQSHVAKSKLLISQKRDKRIVFIFGLVNSKLTDPSVSVKGEGF